jgi:acetylglutamate kinase
MESVVIKLSGSLTDDQASIECLARHILELSSQNIHSIIIHGGGKQINELSKSLGVEIIQVQGRRVTSAETIDILSYTVAGSINISLVSSLRQLGIKAVGITGADGEVSTSIKRKPLNINGSDVDFKFVGEITELNPDLIFLLSKNGYTPVVGCLTWSEADGILNINADTFATQMAVSCASKELLVLMDPPFVRNAENKRINELSFKDFTNGISDGWIVDGMIPKLKTGFEALNAGVKTVRLTNPAGLSSDSGTNLIL